MAKYAVVDIGTNSARLMIAETKGKTVKSIYKTLRTIRVGEGMTTQRKITQGAMHRTLDTLNEYLQMSRECDAFFCFATSAVRDARNRDEYVEFIRTGCGVEIDIISGENEALFGFAGSVSGFGGMFDIGGGSTEITVGTAADIRFSHSFNIGTVRMLQMFPSSDLADQQAFERAHKLAADTFSGIPHAVDFAYTGIGGTATALAAIDLELSVYDPKLIQGHKISLKRSSELCDMLKSKTKQQRQELVGLEENRADVIVIGSILMLEIMKASGSDEIIVSDSDNQEGYLAYKLGLL
jgi:exopolyphosphatase/guanosine-5'-triphosphate,3'-diphosphate pyrophosphatase